MAVTVDTDILDQLNSTEARALFSISDKLGACGVGKIVNLPRIIVVGDQSSGKSSILEAISHVRFPVEGGVCTRFATELVLRNSQSSSVNVSVKFADGKRETHSFQRTDFSQDDLPEIIKEAKKCMVLSDTDGTGFSKDVLRLEISGPEMYPLTLVDLPGLFHSKTATQSLSGKQTVDELVDSYMRETNSIILVVVTADRELSHHAALSRVEKFDPSGDRTIGVITKPDLARPGLTYENMYMDLAKNQDSGNKLKLGWHVLRNRAEDESSLDERDGIEDTFFNKGAWSTLPKHDLGIAMFRRKLSKVLFEHIRTSLPRVTEDIESKLHEREKELRIMGKPRTSKDDMRSFLLEITVEFQRLVRDGINGRYYDKFFGNVASEDMKLRAQLRSFRRAFDHIMRTKGSHQKIIMDSESSDEDEEETDEIPEHLEQFLMKHGYIFPTPESVDESDLVPQLQQEAAANQGCEFPGTPSPELVIQLFKRHAAPWGEIAKFHILRVIMVTKLFVEQLIIHIAGPSETNKATEAILSRYVDTFFVDKEKSLVGKLDEFMAPYREGFALPADEELQQTVLKKSNRRKAQEAYHSLAEEHPEIFDKDFKGAVTKRMITDSILAEGREVGDEFGTEQVIDMMLAYYENSRRTFTDNVMNLAIEACLIQDVPNILTPTDVGRMSGDELAELAAEDEVTQSRRALLQQEIKMLRDGLAQCRRYKPRTMTVVPSVRVSPNPPAANGQLGASTARTNDVPSTSPSPQPATGLFSQTGEKQRELIRDNGGGLFSFSSNTNDASPSPSNLFSGNTATSNNSSPAPISVLASTSKPAPIDGRNPFLWTKSEHTAPSPGQDSAVGQSGVSTPASRYGSPFGAIPPTGNSSFPFIKSDGLFGGTSS